LSIFPWKLVKVACPNQIDISGEDHAKLIISMIKIGVARIINVSDELIILKQDLFFEREYFS
jgi:hypothetical protein